MARLNVSPTKSHLLGLRRQLAFAEEGYDLLDQKRQILIYELMERLDRAEVVQQRVNEAARAAHAALREATWEMGSAGVDGAALAVGMDHRVSLSPQPIMGLRLSRVQASIEPPGVRFGVVGTSAHADQAMCRFVELLPLLAELAEVENAVIRLARELRKTQRRCNALSKIFIPAHRETIAYIAGALEERERESLVVLKMIRGRLRRR